MGLFLHIKPWQLERSKFQFGKEDIKTSAVSDGSPRAPITSQAPSPGIEYTFMAESQLMCITDLNLAGSSSLN